MIVDGNLDFPVGTGQFDDLTNSTPQSASFFGQQGWWTVPTSWFMMTDAGNQIWASPNSDFSTPKYACKLNVDGTLVFQDLMTQYFPQPSRPPNVVSG